MAEPPPPAPRPVAAGPFTVMAKPAGPACNLACDYCFYRGKTALFPAGSPTRMSDAVLESFVRQYCEAGAWREVAFAWQGGEPTLMGLDFFRRAVELQRRYAGGRRVTNALQTNGVLLDDAWAAFLAEHGFLVGVSVDGPSALHDRHRRDGAGGPTLDRVLRGVEALRRARVEFNTLTVVGSHNAGRPVEVYEFLKGIGSTFHQYIPLVERASARSLRPAVWGTFLGAVFDRWIRADVGTVFVQQFEAALAAWTGRPPGICVLDERCGAALVLEHDGSLYACDHFVDPGHRLGSILQTPLANLARSPRQVAFGDAKHDALPRQCRECAVLAACRGGCPKNRVARTRDGEPGLDHLCEGWKAFLAHARPGLDLVARLLGAGRPAALAMEAVRADERRRAFAAAGRNDPCPCGSGRKFKQCCGAVARSIGDPRDRPQPSAGHFPNEG